MTTPLFMLSEIARSMLSLIFLLLCLVNIFSIVLSVSAKRYYFSVLSLFPFLCCYFLWQVLFDIHLSAEPENAARLTLKLVNLPIGCWLIFLLVLMFAAIFIFTRVVLCSRQNVTPAAIKLCLDEMPCGICCWQNDGRVLFSNACINRLCINLTGSYLLDGNQFYDTVSGGVLKTGEKVWRFSFGDIFLGGEKLHEIIASDITAEYSKTQALEQEKADLLRLNSELKEYTLSIDDTVRRQEILQAKVNIHDEMNKLMLSSQAAADDSAALDRVFSQWEQNALLLCMQSDEIVAAPALSRIEKLAEALKIKLVFEGELPDTLSEKQRSLFFSAAQEAVVNAVKHAGAKTVAVSLSEQEDFTVCRFTNNGNIPSGKVEFSGGLANLTLLAQRQGAGLRVESGKEFSLILRFPKNDNNRSFG